jgi:hypothetical protein
MNPPATRDPGMDPDPALPPESGESGLETFEFNTIS